MRDRLTRLSQASLRINASLDFDTVLQGVLDSARDLTGADYGVITVLDEDRNLKDYLAAGISAAQASRLWEFPAGLQIFDYLNGIGEPRRFDDFLGHLRSRGLPEVPLSAPVGQLLLAPIQHVGELVGTIFVARDRARHEFDREDEEILTTFASQAALVIANARRYHDEQRARHDLEALIDTSPVGVMVFDGLSGQVVSANREARRIAAEIKSPDCTLEQLLEVVILRRADGTVLSLADFELVQALNTGELVRAEEITFEVPGGKRIALLVNATPIRSAEGRSNPVWLPCRTLLQSRSSSVCERNSWAPSVTSCVHRWRPFGDQLPHSWMRIDDGPGRIAAVPPDHPGADRSHARVD